LPHALAAATHAWVLAVAPEVSLHILNQTGLYLRGRMEFAEGKVLYDRALTLAEEAYGPDHPEVAAIVNNLGGVLGALDDLKGAKEHYERVLSLFRKSLGEDHQSRATVRKNLELLANV